MEGEVDIIIIILTPVHYLQHAVPLRVLSIEVQPPGLDIYAPLSLGESGYSYTGNHLCYRSSYVTFLAAGAKCHTIDGELPRYWNTCIRLDPCDMTHVHAINLTSNEMVSEQDNGIHGNSLYYTSYQVLVLQLAPGFFTQS